MKPRKRGLSQNTGRSITAWTHWCQGGRARKPVGGNARALAEGRADRHKHAPTAGKAGANRSGQAKLTQELNQWAKIGKTRSERPRDTEEKR